ncbi:hypothetical protein DTO96_102539 [Ephemeroptericola cinctiostellae]|uniref:Uncharacterized protein n=1 Tax=Ephemeroptericola cinctiostellae TaxID=2268024 RepID=A0A345DEJ5_9BURK|nr:hypothetical protein [Ephemeroptericola cinctiostellae]AXF86783.1 hypothetical protein DTO96_102539 [Ephemeroptericola cinctiostellae]
MDFNWVVVRLAWALSGLFGAFALSVFWLPRKIEGRAAIAKGAIIGGTGVAVPLVFTGLVLRQLGLDGNDLDTAMPVAFVLGMLALALINWIANAVDRREDVDIIDVAREVRGGELIDKKEGE